jgi:hypothetical protein
MVTDFLDKFKSVWKPLDIMTPEFSGLEHNVPDPADDEDEIIAQALADHLNVLQDFYDRFDALDYLGKQARRNFDNISYSTTSESLINDILAVGGSGQSVDFFLIQDCLTLIFQWIESAAADSITADLRGKL